MDPQSCAESRTHAHPSHQDLWAIPPTSTIRHGPQELREGTRAQDRQWMSAAVRNSTRIFCRSNDFIALAGHRNKVLARIPLMNLASVSCPQATGDHQREQCRCADETTEFCSHAHATMRHWLDCGHAAPNRGSFGSMMNSPFSMCCIGSFTRLCLTDRFAPPGLLGNRVCEARSRVAVPIMRRTNGPLDRA